MSTPLIRKIDCILFYVSDLDSGIRFYEDKLGHKLIWRTEDSAGLQMPESDAEIVIQTARKTQETDLLVEDVEEAVKQMVEAGSSIVETPFDIRVGRCAVVDDPWGNRLVILDLSKGTLLTNGEGKVIGNNARAIVP